MIIGSGKYSSPPGMLFFHHIGDYSRSRDLSICLDLASPLQRGEGDESAAGSYRFRADYDSVPFWNDSESLLVLSAPDRCEILRRSILVPHLPTEWGQVAQYTLWLF
jgi:hypothetical protein